MRTIIALLGLAATCVTADPFKFTLSIRASNVTDIDGLGLADSVSTGSTIGYLNSVSSLDQKPTVFWLEHGTKGRLITQSANGTLRYAWSWDKVYVGTIQFDQLGGDDGTIWYPDFEITSDNLLIYSTFPWSFCPTDIELMKRDNPNLDGPLMLGESGCTYIEGVNVVPTK